MHHIKLIHYICSRVSNNATIKFNEMKLKVNQKTEDYFKPIELVLTIETAEELCDLWHRFDTKDVRNPGEINDCLKKTKSINFTDIFDSLDNLVKQYKLKS